MENVLAVVLDIYWLFYLVINMLVELRVELENDNEIFLFINSFHMKKVNVVLKAW